MQPFFVEIVNFVKNGG